jgi:polar amino acid transport system substrate-binding protein
MRRLLLLAIPLSALALTATSTGGGAVSAASASCAKADLQTVTDGKLTVGTDNPAYPPWFGGTPSKGSKWKVSDPTSGKGFESAVAFAVAKQLGFGRNEVVWTYVPFAKSYAPGSKSFDFDINEISYTPQRAKVVDFSNSYYDVNQAVVVNKGTPIAAVRSVAGLRKYRLGVQLGTTSYNAIVNDIKPAQKPRVYDTNDKAVFALKSKQIDALVVDLPTAFYVTAVQVPNGKILGQLQSKTGEHFGMVLKKGNPLTACVNQALAKLKANGTLRRIQALWLAKVAGAPVLK